MIFITVGSAFPFDRLIQSMDNWAHETGRGNECLAQIGRSRYQPTHMEWHDTLDHAHFNEVMRQATLIVAHAGMGSVITAHQHATSIVVLPRKFEAGEHTTDHQMATARWLANKPGVFVAWSEDELAEQITRAESQANTHKRIAGHAPVPFTERLAQQLNNWANE